MNVGARNVTWIEANESRCMMTGAGPLPVYKGEFVMVIAGKTLEECQRLVCELYRARGESVLEASKDRTATDGDK